MRLFAMCGLAASLVACGAESTPGTGNGTDTTDTTSTSDTEPTTDVVDTTSPDTADTTADTASDVSLVDTTPPDTTQPADTNTADTTTNDTSSPTCSRNGFVGTDSYFEYDEEYNYTTFGVWNDTAEIMVEFYDFGDGSPLNGVGSYPIGNNADDRNYETCETCVLLYADCGAESCDKIFYATGGTIVVSAIDQAAGTITAKLTNLVAVEVTIDSQSYRSTPVANGETYCVDSVDVNSN